MRECNNWKYQLPLRKQTFSFSSLYTYSKRYLLNITLESHLRKAITLVYRQLEWPPLRSPLLMFTREVLLLAIWSVILILAIIKASSGVSIIPHLPEYLFCQLVCVETQRRCIKSTGNLNFLVDNCTTEKLYAQHTLRNN